MEWISVEDQEQLPFQSKIVLGAWYHSETQLPMVTESWITHVLPDKNHQSYWHYWRCNDTSEIDTGWKITHWMSLPDPPEATQ